MLLMLLGLGWIDWQESVIKASGRAYPAIVLVLCCVPEGTLNFASCDDILIVIVQACILRRRAVS